MRVKAVGETPVGEWIELVFQDLDMGIKAEKHSGGGIISQSWDKS